MPHMHNPYDAIPHDVQQQMEQGFALIGDMLDHAIASVQYDLAKRFEAYGIRDDSAHWYTGAIKTYHSLDHQAMAQLLMAALIRLARTPHVDDPLEQMIQGNPAKGHNT